MPARGAPGRGPAPPDENGLLPGRGPPGRGPGRGPAAGADVGAASGVSDTGSADGVAVSTCATGSTSEATGIRGPGKTEEVASMTSSTAGAGAAAFLAAAFFTGAGAAAALSAASFNSGNFACNLRTAGGNTVADADLTYSPISSNLAIISLLSKPHSLASSYTRTLDTFLQSGPTNFTYRTVYCFFALIAERIAC